MRRAVTALLNWTPDVPPKLRKRSSCRSRTCSSFDIVGYSKLLLNEQRRLRGLLNEMVRGTEQFRTAEEKGRLISLPPGGGMALVSINRGKRRSNAPELSRADKVRCNRRQRSRQLAGAGIFWLDGQESGIAPSRQGSFRAEPRRRDIARRKAGRRRHLTLRL